MKREIVNRPDQELAKKWASRPSGGQKEINNSNSESIYKASQEAKKLIEGFGQPIKKEVTPVIQENFMDDNSDFETAQYNSNISQERKESTNY